MGKCVKYSKLISFYKPAVILNWIELLNISRSRIARKTFLHGFKTVVPLSLAGKLIDLLLAIVKDQKHTLQYD